MNKIYGSILPYFHNEIFCTDEHIDWERTSTAWEETSKSFSISTANKVAKVMQQWHAQGELPEELKQRFLSDIKVQCHPKNRSSIPRIVALSLPYFQSILSFAGTDATNVIDLTRYELHKGSALLQAFLKGKSTLPSKDITVNAAIEFIKLTYILCCEKQLKELRVDRWYFGVDQEGRLAIRPFGWWTPIGGSEFLQALQALVYAVSLKGIPISLDFTNFLIPNSRYEEVLRMLVEVQDSTLESLDISTWHIGALEGSAEAALRELEKLKSSNCSIKI